MASEGLIYFGGVSIVKGGVYVVFTSRYGVSSAVYPLTEGVNMRIEGSISGRQWTYRLPSPPPSAPLEVGLHVTRFTL